MTTLGVMARAPVAGKCKTRLSGAVGAEGAAALYEAMLRDTLDAMQGVGATRLVVLAAPEDDGVLALRSLVESPWEIVPQVGTGLGERLVNAFRTLGTDGGPVVLSDSDSPTVPISPIAQALHRFVEPRRAIVGPCEDGGYYLIGLTTLELGVLEQIPWSTAQVMATTRARCRTLGLSLQELPVGYDVDDARDLDRLRAELTTHPERAPRTAAAVSRLLVSGGTRDAEPW
jgi:rSAM/selenodomain-associated transferase 1